MKGKEYAKNGVSCCEVFLNFVFKHLIHVFLVAFIIAFAGMLYIVSGEKTDNMGLGDDTVQQIEMLDNFISHHPMYFGLSKLAEAVGPKGIKETTNTTNGLMKYSGVMQQWKENAEKKNAAPGFMIHPLYV